jgi:hypothetical protein
MGNSDNVLMNETTVRFDNQKTFDIVVNALRKQGEKSVSDVDVNSCLYRGPNGLKCAAGHLIPDELYNKKMEGVSCDHIQVSEVLQKCGHDHKFVKRLQWVHDDLNVNRWEDFFKVLAIEYGLIYNEPIC